MMDTKAKPCCLLLSVLFTDANPHCSSSRVSQGIKCALWKHVHLKVLWRSGSELLNGDGFSHPSLPLFFPCLSLFFSFPRRKHRLRTPITWPRIPVPKAGFFQTQQIWVSCCLPLTFRPCSVDSHYTWAQRVPNEPPVINARGKHVCFEYVAAGARLWGPGSTRHMVYLWSLVFCPSNWGRCKEVGAHLVTRPGSAQTLKI